MIKGTINKDSGITLVALVVTIVVLLILASATISMVFDNNGVITRSKTAVIVSQKAEAKEDIEMAIAESNVEHEANPTKTLRTIYEEDNNNIIHKNVRGTAKDIVVTDTNVVGIITKGETSFRFTIDLQNLRLASLVSIEEMVENPEQITSNDIMAVRNRLILRGNGDLSYVNSLKLSETEPLEVNSTNINEEIKVRNVKDFITNHSLFAITNDDKLVEVTPEGQVRNISDNIKTVFNIAGYESGDKVTWLEKNGKLYRHGNKISENVVSAVKFYTDFAGDALLYKTSDNKIKWWYEGFLCVPQNSYDITDAQKILTFRDIMLYYVDSKGDLITLENNSKIEGVKFFNTTNYSQNESDFFPYRQGYQLIKDKNNKSYIISRNGDKYDFSETELEGVNIVSAAKITEFNKYGWYVIDSDSNAYMIRYSNSGNCDFTDISVQKLSGQDQNYSDALVTPEENPTIFMSAQKINEYLNYNTYPYIVYDISMEPRLFAGDRYTGGYNIDSDQYSVLYEKHDDKWYYSTRYMEPLEPSEPIGGEE